MMKANSKKGTDLFCDGCNRDFQSKGPLDTHKLICTRPVNKEKTQSASSFNAWNDCNGSNTRNNQENDATDKLLPLSQPLDEPEKENNSPQPSKGATASTPPANNKTCPHCKKELKTAKSLKPHIKNCKKNKSVLAQNKGASSKQNKQNSDVQAPQEAAAEETTPVNNSLGWGVHTDPELAHICNQIYEELVFWRKDLFKLPSGSAGKRYLVKKMQLCVDFDMNLRLRMFHVRN